VIVCGFNTTSILAGRGAFGDPRERRTQASDLPQDCCKLADPLFVARQKNVEESADSTGTLDNGRGAHVENSVHQQQTSAQTVIQDATTTAILTAVEQQLTRYFGAMAARADAVQQAGEAGRAELITHFQHQIDLLRAEVDRSHHSIEGYEQALQTALEERLTEFAANQHWRFAEMEGRLDRLGEEVALGPISQIEAATSPIHFASSGLLTSGGKTMRTSAFASPPSVWAMPEAMRSIFSLMVAITSLRKARTVPRKTAVSGITL